MWVLKAEGEGIPQWIPLAVSGLLIQEVWYTGRAGTALSYSMTVPFGKNSVQCGLEQVTEHIPTAKFFKGVIAVV